jgi:hypothetical protein
MLEAVLAVIQGANKLSARFFDSTFALVHHTPVRAATQKRVLPTMRPSHFGAVCVTQHGNVADQPQKYRVNNLP